MGYCCFLFLTFLSANNANKSFNKHNNSIGGKLNDLRLASFLNKDFLTSF